MPLRSDPVPARIHLLAAREAPYVIVIRRKPSKIAHILRWNTQTDEIEYGSWFHGRIYEMRSDVSFDGQWMTYLAFGTSGTWTGICQPPFLRTAVHWENIGTWHGGGVFTSSKRLLANAGYQSQAMAQALNESKVRLPFHVEALADPVGGEDEGVLYPRFERDGFRRVGPMPPERKDKARFFAFWVDDDPGWECCPSQEHPTLRVRYRGYASGRGRIFEFDLPEYPSLLTPDVSWAVWDSCKQLIFARQGVLYRYTLEGIRTGRPSAVFDLESLTPPLRPPPEEQKPRPRVWDDNVEEEPTVRPRLFAMMGSLEDQGGHTLVISQSDSPVARRVRSLAGEFLERQLAEEEPFPEVFATAAYYLPQHNLIHVREPAPEDGLEALQAACKATMEAVQKLPTPRIALRPIGLDAGWPFEVAAMATIKAAEACLAVEPVHIYLVADSPDQLEMLSRLLT